MWFAGSSSVAESRKGQERLVVLQATAAEIDLWLCYSLTEYGIAEPRFFRLQRFFRPIGNSR